jgi:hypothetical protein
MKKRTAVKLPVPTEEERNQDYGERLSELEAELRGCINNTSGATANLVTVTGIKVGHIGKEAIVQFSHKGKVFAAGHTDSAFPGTNEARGVRRIHLYNEDHAVVLGISGDYENHQFGANFRFRNVKTFIPGPWEVSFLAITTGLRAYRAEYKDELRRRRAAALRKRA